MPKCLVSVSKLTDVFTTFSTLIIYVLILLFNFILLNFFKLAYIKHVRTMYLVLNIYF